jgi:signal transduction histidine kinase
MAQPGDPVTHIMGSTEGAFWWPPDSPTTEFLSRSQFVIREEFKAVAAFPLRVAEKTDPIAALFFNYRQPHEFTAEERRALPILAAIAAANMKDAQLIDAAKRGEDAAKRSEKRLQVAVEVAKAAGAYWERDKVLPAILVALRDHFAQYLAHATPYLLLYNDDDKVLELPEEARSFYPTQEGSTQPVRLSLDAPRIVSKVARRCLEEKRAVVENRDVTKETDYEPPDTETQSELCAGLWRDGNLLGVLVLKSRQSDAFTEEDEKLFELVAEQAAAALERANQVAEKRVSDYLTGAMAWASDIAHDINVDISYIRYRTYWLRERDLGITEQGKAWAREIDARAGELADKARDESSARAGILVDFGGSLEKKVRDWQARSCPNTRINYDWGETALPVEVYFELVWKAVRHLLRNAAEAMAYKGQIWLRLRPIGVDQVELQVENNGADIPPDVRQKIFRELVSTKQGGMGLLLAKKLIEKMGGGIRLLPSQPNCGPVFAIRLPRVQKPQEV